MQIHGIPGIPGVYGRPWFGYTRVAGTPESSVYPSPGVPLEMGERARVFGGSVHLRPGESGSRWVASVWRRPPSGAGKGSWKGWGWPPFATPCFRLGQFRSGVGPLGGAQWVLSRSSNTVATISCGYSTFFLVLACATSVRTVFQCRLSWSCCADPSMHLSWHRLLPKMRTNVVVRPHLALLVRIRHSERLPAAEPQTVHGDDRETGAVTAWLTKPKRNRHS